MEKNTGRNSYDIIMELVSHHIKIAFQEGNPVTAEGIEDVYLKYYKLIKENK